MGQREQVRGYVDKGILARFRAKHGKYASISWLLETSMEGLLAMTENDPALDAVVKTAISKHIEDQRSSQQRKPDDIRVVP